MKLKLLTLLLLAAAPTAEIEIEKAGEIIPQVLSVVEKSSAEVFSPPHECPSCETHLVREDGKVVLVGLKLPG